MTNRRGGKDRWKNVTLKDRFDSGYAIDATTGCWLWKGSKTTNGGYGRIFVDGKPSKAHRAAWLLYRGPLLPGQDNSVCHTCDTPACVNPKHLFLGSVADNTKDRQAKGRQARGTQHGSARLSDADVRSIKQKALSGVRKYKLAAEYGVTFTAIRRIVTGQAWTHVEV